MRHGCMERLNRKRGPQVWQFRWSETSPSGKRLYHKKIVGTVEQCPDSRRMSETPQSTAAERRPFRSLLHTGNEWLSGRVPHRLIGRDVAPTRRP